MTSSKDISLFEIIISICACLGFILIVFGITLLSENYHNHFRIKIEITKINEINNLTSYTFDLKDSLASTYCGTKIKKSEIC